MVTVEQFENKNAAAFAAVDWFVKRVNQVIEKSDGCRVVVPTGGSPAAFYDVLTKEYATACNWNKVEWITLDEYYAINQRHDATFYTALQQSLWRPLKVRPINVVALNPEPYDTQAECERFSMLSCDADIVILGVGADGHIGMNFPPAKATSHTHVLDLPEQALPASALFAESESCPSQGITMGISEILSGKAILLLVDGAKKAAALKQLLHGSVSDEWPVTHLQGHPETRAFVTEDALA